VANRELTAERLRELLDYDPKSGVWVWRISRKRMRIGSVAGSINGDGYRRLMVDGRRYQASRLAWLYVIGSWPIAEIDHKNLDKADDRFCNLRECTRLQNQAPLAGMDSYAR
jgi:hypothetical protein